MKTLIKFIYTSDLSNSEENHIRITNIGFDVIETTCMSNLQDRIDNIFDLLAYEQNCKREDAIYYMMAGFDITYQDMCNALKSAIPITNEIADFINKDKIFKETYSFMGILNLAEDNIIKVNSPSFKPRLYENESISYILYKLDSEGNEDNVLHVSKDKAEIERKTSKYLEHHPNSIVHIVAVLYDEYFHAKDTEVVWSNFNQMD